MDSPLKRPLTVHTHAHYVSTSPAALPVYFCACTTCLPLHTQHVTDY